MGALTELLAKVEAAEGPIRELDIAIWRALSAPDAPESKIPLPWMHCYTESIDAALTLVALVLPGAMWEITTTGRSPGATILGGGRAAGGAYAPTVPLAILAATLRALIAKAAP